MSEVSETRNQSESGTLPEEVVGDRFGFLFAKMHQRCAKLSIEALEDAGLGLSGLHVGALKLIEVSGPMPQNAVGSALGKDRTTMVSVVDDLERSALVERRRNPRDRRAYALEITEHGRDWLQRATAVIHETESSLLSDLDGPEREQLRGLLRRVVLAPSPGSGDER